jgi:hypothetical protein
MRLKSLQEVADFFDETVKANPNRNMLDALNKALKGEKREYPVISIQQNGMDIINDDDIPDELPLPSLDISDPVEKELAEALIANIRPLRMLNPIPGFIRMGELRFILTSFGVPYIISPDSHNYTKTVDQVLKAGIPSLSESGLLPVTREKINLIKQSGCKIKIALPDMQGPFNLAHALVGSEIMCLPYEDKGKYTEFMNLLTRFWIEVRKVMVDWIGEDYKCVNDIPTRIAECDVNMVSTDFYKEFILPFDMQISQTTDALHIHPCSGSHVFHATLNMLPNISWTEAGEMIETKTTAGSISVDEALDTIGKRKIMLSIGQELPFGKEYEFIKRDIDRYKSNYYLTFSYTGVNWHIKNRPQIREIHKRLDEYWAKEIWGRS